MFSSGLCVHDLFCSLMQENNIFVVEKWNSYVDIDVKYTAQKSFYRSIQV